MLATLSNTPMLFSSLILKLQNSFTTLSSIKGSTNESAITKPETCTIK